MWADFSSEIIFLFKIGHCVWSEWWDTDCSKTCGIGKKIQRRYNRIPGSLDAEASCGNLTETREIDCHNKAPCKLLGSSVFSFRLFITIIKY